MPSVRERKASRCTLTRWEEKPFYIRKVSGGLYEVGSVWGGCFKANRAGLQCLLKLVLEVLFDEQACDG